MPPTSLTRAANSVAGAGGPGPGGVPYQGGSAGPFGSAGSAGSGGSIVVQSHLGTAINERDSLVSAGVPGNCIGAITDGGHDLSFPDISCPHAIAVDPKLGALGDYGGPTQTMALHAASAALNQGAACPSTDQRGVVRPQGGACDIGAFEVARLVCRPVAASVRGTHPVIVQLSCADPSGL